MTEIILLLLHVLMNYTFINTGIKALVKWYSEKNYTSADTFKDNYDVYKWAVIYYPLQLMHPIFVSLLSRVQTGCKSSVWVACSALQPNRPRVNNSWSNSKIHFVRRFTNNIRRVYRTCTNRDTSFSAMFSVPLKQIILFSKVLKLSKYTHTHTLL